jgi:hypothetical protein
MEYAFGNIRKWAPKLPKPIDYSNLKASDLTLSDEEENDGVEGECDNEVVEVVDTQMTTMSK